MKYFDQVLMIFLILFKVGRVIELLKTTTHNGFPVVEPVPEVTGGLWTSSCALNVLMRVMNGHSR